MPSRAMPSARICACFVVRLDRHRLLGKRDGAEPPLLRPRRLRARGIEGDVVARDDTVGKARFDLGKRDRRR